MIEIVRYGPGTKEISCPQCQSLLQYDEVEDVVLREQNQIKIEYITCPICETHIVVRRLPQFRNKKVVLSQ